MSKKPVLGYWNIRGTAQPLRFLLAYAGVDFEDKAYDMGNNGAEWFDVKFKLGFDFPNLPYYEDGSIKLTQSGAILRYLGRKHDLYGQDDEEAGFVEMMAFEALELHIVYGKVVYDPDFENAKVKHLETVEKKFKQFEEYLGDKPFFVGDISVADFYLYEIIAAHRDMAPEVVGKFQKLSKFLERFEALPTIEAYMESPGYIKGPQNFPSAKFGG